MNWRNKSRKYRKYSNLTKRVGGGRKKGMANTKENTTSGSKVVARIGSTDGAVNLRGQHSQADQAKATDSDAYALEILQKSVLEVGGRGIGVRSWNSEYNGKSVIMIAVFDSRICGICGLWHSDEKDCAKVAA